MSDEKPVGGRRLRVRERRRYTEEYPDEEEDILFERARAFDLDEKLASDRFVDPSNSLLLEMTGGQLTLNHWQENGFEQPILIRQPAGLGMKMPPKTFSVNDVKQCVGSRRVLDVMDVETQRDFHMTMKEWCNYYNQASDQRDRLLNVISLEFSHTKLESYVESPAIVKAVDWIDWVWPKYLKQMQTEGTNAIEDMKYPKVQKYCLMSVKNCYTDFHIDFGGTSVWYHILKGKKVFWLIPPSERNIQLYEQWVLSGKQSDVFFGDTVDQCIRINLEDGYTFFIPTGWIHAVYTPEDSLVFGGNFLHSFGIEKQLRVAQVEDVTKVPSKFRYPFYTEVLWYVLARYVFCLMGKNHLSVNEDGTPIQTPKTEPGQENDQKGPGAGTNSIANGSPAGQNGQLVNGKVGSNIHLTPLELNGLKAIIMWLSRLAPSKRSLPELIVSAEALLNDAKVLIDEHSRDSHKLAVTGKPVLFWSSRRQSGQSLTSQLRQFKHHHPSNSMKIKNLLNASSSSQSSNEVSTPVGGPPARPESPPTRPLSSNQYRINVGATITQDLIPSSFAGLIAATGVGQVNASFNPRPPQGQPPLVAIPPPSMLTLPSSGYLPVSVGIPAAALMTQAPGGVPCSGVSVLPPSPSITGFVNGAMKPMQPTMTLPMTLAMTTPMPIPPPVSSLVTTSNSLQQQSLSMSSMSSMSSTTSTQTNFAQDLAAGGNSQPSSNHKTGLHSLVHQTGHQGNHHQSNQSNSSSNQTLSDPQPQQTQKSSFSKPHPPSTSTQVQTQTMHFPVAVPPSGFHQEKGTSMTKVSKSSSNDNSRRRRTRCKKCDSCLRADCGECHFCKDMKKFGGPGRMKQSCIARQCLAPVLPHTACCMVCGRDGWEKLNIQVDGQLSDETASSLMECSQCWEIVHPFCLGEKFADLNLSGGNVNSDLPNSWECPRCVKAGKTPTSGKSKSKNATTNNSSTNTNVSLTSIGTSTGGSPMCIKTEDEGVQSSPKRLKLDDESPPSTEDDEDDDEDDDDEDGDEPDSEDQKSGTGTGHVRSCARYPPLSSKSGLKNGSPTKLSTSGSKRKNESTRDRLFKSLKGLKKSHSEHRSSSQMHMIKKAAKKLHKDPSSSSNSSVDSPPVNRRPFDDNSNDLQSTEDNSNDFGIRIRSDDKRMYDDESTEDEDQENISNLIASRNSMSSKSANGHQRLEGKELKKPLFVVRPAPLEEDLSPTTESSESRSGEETSEDEDGEVKMKKQRQRIKRRHLKRFRRKKNGNLALERDAVFPMLHHLDRSDVLNCMLVCKLWNRWSCDPSLWARLDLTRKKVTSSALIGIVRRQPQHLTLSWTNVSKRQLAWLIARLPRLWSLSMAGCSSMAVNALSSCNCPFLRALDLSWCDGVDDETIRELLSAPSDSRPGVVETKTRLRLLQQISLTGSEISDVSIRLMTHHLPNLTHVDMSHCNKITDMGIAVLGAAKSAKLEYLNLASCAGVSDTSLDSLKRCSFLLQLDLRDCPQVTETACGKFVSSCSTSGRKMRTADKLIETV